VVEPAVFINVAYHDLHVGAELDVRMVDVADAWHYVVDLIY